MYLSINDEKIFWSDLSPKKSYLNIALHFDAVQFLKIILVQLRYPQKKRTSNFKCRPKYIFGLFRSFSKLCIAGMTESKLLQ